MKELMRVRKIFAATTNPNQLTVQFQQSIPEIAGGSNPLLAMAQGVSNNSNGPTALFPFNKTVLENAGVSEVDLSNASLEEQRALYEKIRDNVFNGQEVAIEITENTLNNREFAVSIVTTDNAKERAALLPEGDPKVNPTTGEILMYNGKAIYRHAQLKLVSQGIKHSLLAHNSVKAPATVDGVINAATAV